MHLAPPHVSESEARLRPSIRPDATIFGYRTPPPGRPGGCGVCYDEAIDCISPLLDCRPPKTPVPPTGVFFIRNRDPGSIRHGCTLDTGRCRDIRRRNPWSGRILACSCLLPQFIEVCSLTNTQAGWLAVIPSPGGSRVPRASFGYGAVERVGIESWAARDKM